MSENPQPSPQPTAVATQGHTDGTAVAETRRTHSRVSQAAAWVGIVAGTVFVVAVIFFSGFILGSHSDRGDGDRPRQDHEMMFREGPSMMRPGQFPGPWGPGMVSPPAGPGQPAQQQPAPGGRP